MVNTTMNNDFPAHSDPARRLALLWGDRRRPAHKGKKHDLSVDKIATVGIELADEFGVQALSMRKVAQALGVGTMSLYTYVPGKADLVEVMIDTIYDQIARVEHDASRGWRLRLAAAAAVSFDAHVKHSWLVHLPTQRAVLGPGTAAKYERELGCVDGIGLTDIEMDSVVSLVNGHVETSARTAAELVATRAESGMSDSDWWRAQAPLLAAFADHTRFPIAARVGTAAGAEHGSTVAADGGFAFGLERILDGVAAMLRSRR